LSKRKLGAGMVGRNRLEPASGCARRGRVKDPFRYFETSPEIIRLAVIMYARYPLSLRRVEDLLFERGIDNAAAQVCPRRLGPSTWHASRTLR
jgi:hypothetical protein